METIQIQGFDTTIYGTWAEANRVLLTSGRFNRVWGALSEDDRARKLVDAAWYMEQRQWKGQKVSDAQEMAWPRTDATDAVGNAVPTNITPVPVERASYLLAGLLCLNPGLLGAGAPTAPLQSIREGPTSASFFFAPNPATNSETGQTQVPEVEAMIEGYLGLAGGDSFGSMLAGVASGTDGVSSFTDEARYIIQDGLS